MFLTREEARELDRRAMEEYGVPGVVLMENAGRGMAELLLSLGVGGPVVVCCGRGNNGGDGFVIARHLDNAAVNVRVLLFGDPDRLAGDASVNYRILTHSGVPLKAYGEDGPDEASLRAELGAADWWWTRCSAAACGGRCDCRSTGWWRRSTPAGRASSRWTSPAGWTATRAGRWGRRCGRTTRPRWRR